MDLAQNVIRYRVTWLSWTMLFTYNLFYLVKLSGGLLSINLYLVTALVLINAVVYFFFYPPRYPYTTNRHIWLVLLLLYMSVTLLWTRAYNYGFQKLWILYSLVLVAFLARRVLVFHIRQYILVFTVLFSIILIWYLNTYGFGGLAAVNELSRFDLAEGLNPIAVAVFLCLGIINLIFYLNFYKPPIYKRVAVWLGIGLALVFAVLTGSKGPIFSLIIALFLPTLIGQRFKVLSRNGVKILLSSVCIIGIALLVILNLKGTDVYSFIEQRFFLQGDNLGSVTSRLSLITFSLNHIADGSVFKLFFGNGSGDFGYAWWGRDTGIYPHNIFIELFFEYGFVSLLIFTYLVASPFVYNWKRGSKLLNTEKYFLTYFYFALLVAQSTEDIEGNFSVFFAIIFFETMKISKKWAIEKK